MNAKGFTLIEVMIVMAILGILASIAIPAMQEAGKAEGKQTTEASAPEQSKSTSFFNTCTSMCED